MPPLIDPPAMLRHELPSEHSRRLHDTTTTCRPARRHDTHPAALGSTEDRPPSHSGKSTPDFLSGFVGGDVAEVEGAVQKKV